MLLNRSLRTVLTTTLLLLPLLAGAASGDPTRDTQRQQFLQAEKALQQGDHKRFDSLRAGLTDYVLYPYLEYQSLRRQLSRAKADQVRHFLEQYADTPLAARLRGAWLKVLFRRGEWQQFLAFHRPGGGPANRCRALLARLHAGQDKQVLSQVEGLWLSRKSQPRTCDPLFKAWREAGYLTRDLVWKRIEMSIRGGNPGLARYLARFLPKADRPWEALWRRVRSNPRLVLNSKLFRKVHRERLPLLVYGIERLARQNPHQATLAWNSIHHRYPFQRAQRAQALRSIALRMARRGQADALLTFQALPNWALNKSVHEWRIRTALRAGNWKQALAWLEALPEEMHQAEEYRYWQGRALEALNRPHEARKFYAGLSLTRSYYGFLAADRLNVGYRIANIPLPGSKHELAALLQIPGIQRARELLQLKYKLEARREWRDATTGMSRRQLERAAKLAHQWKWHHQAIATVAKARHWDDLDTRFPLAYSQRVRRQARSRHLDQAWVFAVLRQESAFAEDARSPAGAMGLMQLMPATARSVARKLKTRMRHSSELLSAELNIKLGTAYLGSVYQRLGSNMVLATAAYNAGPRRVRQWLPDETMPAELWVELVPFRETRNYLRRVLAYTVIYEQRLGHKPTRLRDRMKPVLNASGIVS